MALSRNPDRGLFSAKNAARQTRWYIRIAVHGRMRRVGPTGGFVTKEAARTFRDRLRAATLEQRYFPDQLTSDLTLERLRTAYLHGIDGKRASLNDQRRHLTWWEATLGGERLVRRLDPTDIERALARLVAKNRSDATANRYAATLRRAMRKLVQPRSWVVDFWARVELYPEPERVMPRYSPEQLRRLFARLDRADALIVYLALLLGIRQGLFFAMRWEWIRWPAALIDFPSYKRQRAFTLPLSADALAVLQAMHREQGRPSRGWVFPAPIQNSSTVDRTVHRDAHNWYTRTFKPVLRELGMPEMTFHALRRTWASLIGERVPQRILQALGNWKDGRVVEGYSRPFDASLRAAIDLVPAALAAATVTKLPEPKQRPSKMARNLLKK